jgi:S1-C subfamily serine protease
LASTLVADPPDELTMPRFLSALLFCCVMAACGDPADLRESTGPEAATRLHWSVETSEGRLLGSATSFGAGRVLTNAHVLAAAGRGDIRLRRDGETLPIRASYAVPPLDLAVLQIEAAGMATPRLRRDLPREAERLFVAGMTRNGLLPGEGRMLAGPAARSFGEGSVVAWLPVSRGYSGAPVVDAQGRLVGIVAAAVTGDMAMARRLSAQQRVDEPSLFVTLLVPTLAIQERVRTAADMRGTSAGPGLPRSRTGPVERTPLGPRAAPAAR